jgi:tetratricopeptide (TPR) repeat protein
MDEHCTELVDFYTRQLLHEPADPPGTYALRAECYFLLGDKESGFADLKKSADLRANDAASVFAYGELALRLALVPSPYADPSIALELAQEAIRLDPSGLTYHTAAGLAYYRIGEWENACESLESIPETGADCLNLSLRAMTYAQLGQEERASSMFRQAAARERELFHVGTAFVDVNNIWTHHSVQNMLFSEAARLLSIPLTPQSLGQPPRP